VFESRRDPSLTVVLFGSSFTLSDAKESAERQCPSQQKIVDWNILKLEIAIIRIFVIYRSIWLGKELIRTIIIALVQDSFLQKLQHGVFSQFTKQQLVLHKKRYSVQIPLLMRMVETPIVFKKFLYIVCK